MELPNPQLMADAQAINVFAQAVTQAVIKLVNVADRESPEYVELNSYSRENARKLQVFVDSLVADLG